MHNIVILNECFLAPSQMARLRRLGRVASYWNTDSEEDVMQRLRGSTIAVANGLLAPLNKKTLDVAYDLKLLVLNSTGFDCMDIDAAKKRKILVANTPGFSTEAVAEHALGLLLAVSRKISLGDKRMRRYPFEINPALSKHREFLGFTLRGKTLGVVGLGAIGMRMAELGRALGMRVVAWNRTPRRGAGVRCMSLKKLLAVSDAVSLHLPLNERTKRIISSRELAHMKPTAVLINTARAELLDERALIRALRKKKIAGAALDVIERLSPRNPLLALPNVVLSPHMAWWTRESLAEQTETIVRTIESFCRKRPINIVRHE